MGDSISVYRKYIITAGVVERVEGTRTALTGLMFPWFLHLYVCTYSEKAQHTATVQTTAVQLPRSERTSRANT